MHWVRFMLASGTPDSWQIEAEMTDTTDTADIEEEEALDMGGISM